MEAIRAAIYETLEREQPMSVRQLYYQLTTQGVIAKTEAQYKGTVVRLLGEMRRAGEVPYGWVADSTRWMRKPRSYTGLEQMLEASARLYRRDLWDTADAYVEVWLEKDALAGVVMDATADWDVPLMVTRGYASLSFLHSAAQIIESKSFELKPTYLYYFGDYDPSGVDIPRVVETRIREIAPEAWFSVEVVAVTPELIEELQLPSRPTKKTDSRSKGFACESVELDAIPANTLRQMVRDVIEQHIDHGELERLRLVERAERDQLHEIAANMNGGSSP